MITHNNAEKPKSVWESQNQYGRHIIEIPEKSFKIHKASLIRVIADFSLGFIGTGNLNEYIYVQPRSLSSKIKGNKKERKLSNFKHLKYSCQNPKENLLE